MKSLPVETYIQLRPGRDEKDYLTVFSPELIRVVVCDVAAGPWIEIVGINYDGGGEEPIATGAIALFSAEEIDALAAELKRILAVAVARSEGK